MAPGPAWREGDEVLAGRCARRLALLCGLELDEFLAAFARVNLVERFPGKAAKGDLFPIGEARAGFARVAPRLRRRRVVLLGAGVAKAAGFDAAPLVWVGPWAICPHPSSVNRWWNEPANLRAARRFWRELARSRD